MVAAVPDRRATLADSARTGLERDGYAILPGLVEPTVADRLAAELTGDFDAVALADAGNRTKRIHSRILATSPTYAELVMHPVVAALLDRVLGPNCVKYQLSSVQGIEVHPGAGHQALHRDDAVFRLPHPHPVFEVNGMWAVTDFSAANGATRVVPGSHLWDDDREPAPDETIVAEMAKGSLLLWLGSTWHAAGANTTDAVRIGAYVGYSLGWLRQEETLYLALPPAVARDLPEPLQRLIGYELKGSLTLGWLDGGDPRAVLE